jgi:hypothetical protein
LTDQIDGAVCDPTVSRSRNNDDLRLVTGRTDRRLGRAATHATAARTPACSLAARAGDRHIGNGRVLDDPLRVLAQA